MKATFFLLIQTLLASATWAQMSDGQYTYFSGDWQIKFEVAANGKKIETFELSDLKTSKTKSGNGEWRSLFITKQSDTEKSQGEKKELYEVTIQGESFRFEVPKYGALMFEFPDGKKVGMKEKK